MAQLQSLHSKMLADSRMRDIRRRVDVIQKKLADLQEMGVPCAFCYSSVRNTGSIFTLGDNRITDVIERHRNEILFNLMDGGSGHDSDTGSSSKEIHLILPVLPAPLEELNRTTLQSMIVGILKDLGIRWSDSKPIWWPGDIPFVPPRSVPENFTGNWIKALKSILKSVYGYFSYDIDSYIASKLESSRCGDETDDPVLLRGGQDVSNEHQELDNIDDEEESEYSEMDEDDQEEVESDVNAPGDPPVENTTNMPPIMTSQYNSTIAPSKPPHNKHISSFTVENILMGKQNSSLSSASNPSPLSSSSTVSMASTVPSSSSMSSSIVGVNWVSHPPVKYTKFTILSPTAMSDDAQKKKRSLYDHSIGPRLSDAQDLNMTSVDESTRHNLKAPFNSQVTYGLQTSITDYRPTTSSPLQAYPLSSLATPSTTKDHSVLTPLTTSARMSTVTSHPASSNNQERKAVLTKTFPPSQKYVLLVPSSSVVATSGLHSVVQSSPVSSKTRIGQSVGNAVSRSNIKAVSFQSSPTVISTSSQKNDSSNRMERVGSTNHVTSESNSFRLIAPKQNTVSVGGGSQESNTNRSKVQKRAVHKPHKLRFHMTTVVTKQKRMTMKNSMTVESPSAALKNAKTTPDSSHSRHAPDKDPPIESTITFSPNVYSSDTGRDDASDVESPNNSSGKIEGEEALHSQKDASIQTGDSNLKNSNFKATSVELRSVGVGIHRCTSDNSLPVEFTAAEPISVHHGGRATRSYTRRKRELTFHLYEEPGTTFKPKKPCKE